MGPERKLEDKCRRLALEAGGMLMKWVSPGNSGVPDRILFLPHGRVLFIEFKAPGAKPTALQTVLHDKLRRLGTDVHVIDNETDFKKLL